MKTKKLLLVFLFFFLVCLLYSNTTHTKINNNNSEPLYGINLCNAVFSKLNKENLSPTTQSLIVGGENAFPYNIILFYPANNQTTLTDSSENNQNLVLQICMEDFFKAEETIINLAKFINTNNFSFNTYILISYGDRQIITKENMIFGSNVFLSSLFNSESSVAVLLNLNTEKNEIISYSNSEISPMWMIKFFYNAFFEQDISKNLESFYISQVFKYSFLTSHKLLSTFMNNGIQSIQLDFNYEAINSGKTETILTDFIQNFSKNYNNQWNQNFLMIKLFNKFFWISETPLVNLIIIVSCIILFLLFFYFVTNKNVAKKFLFSEKNIWYFPAIYIFLMIFCHFLGTNIFYEFIKSTTSENKFLYLIFFNFTFVFLSFFSFAKIKIQFSKKYYKEKALDLQALILSFANLIIFSLVDITLYPIFLLEFFIFLICYKRKNKGSKFIYLLLAILIFLPYVYTFSINLNLKNWEQIIIYNKNFTLCLILIFAPIVILLFRIFSYWVRQKNFKFEKTSLLFYVIVIFLIYSSSEIFKLNTKKIETKPKITIHSLEKNISYIDFSYSDEKVFEDIVRTISVDFLQQPVQCVITVSSSKNPILYSNNEYISSKIEQATFLIPYYPPKQMIFEYGTKNLESLITITAIFKDSDYNYTMQTRNIQIGKTNE